MPRHANSTSFQSGYKPSPESERKRAESLRRAYQEGRKAPPRNPWTEEIRARYRAQAEAGAFDKQAIGATRLQKCGSKIYRLVKIAPGGHGWKYEHRLMMEQIVGRPLLRSEQVHHKNGDSLDNRPENLEMLSASDHNRVHDSLKGQRYAAQLSPGQWSRHYPACIQCGLATSVHAAKGVCRRCYERLRRASRSA